MRLALLAEIACNETEKLREHRGLAALAVAGFNIHLLEGQKHLRSVMEPAILAAAMSLVLFALTRITTAKEAKSDFLTAKLEVLAMSVRELLNAAYPPPMNGPETRAFEETAKAIAHATHAIALYVDLYFPSAQPRAEAIVVPAMAMDSLLILPHDFTPEKALELAAHYGALQKAAPELLKYLRDNQDELTKRTWRTRYPWLQ